MQCIRSINFAASFRDLLIFGSPTLKNPCSSTPAATYLEQVSIERTDIFWIKLLWPASTRLPVTFSISLFLYHQKSPRHHRAIHFVMSPSAVYRTSCNDLNAMSHCTAGKNVGFVSFNKGHRFSDTASSFFPGWPIK